MTNHPRRLGRRKLQRQAERAPRRFGPWSDEGGVDLTRYLQSVRIGNRVLTPSRVTFHQASSA